jgi:hypothetical protein
MNLINTLGLAMGASWVSGINLYASVATLGLLSRFAHFKLPGELNVLNNWWIIGVALAMYVIEFVADKIPVVDSTWDVIHTFIRIPAGAALSMAAFGDFDPTVQAVAFLCGGGLALSSHGTKAATRAALNTVPEPMTNIAASLLEDAIAVGSVVLATFYPVIIMVVIVIAVLISFFVLPRILRYFRGILATLRGSGQPASDA